MLLNSFNLKILLTGADGFLGSYIKKKPSLHEFYSLSRYSSDFSFDLSMFIPTFNKISFDCVIHAAGKAHSLPKNKSEIQEFYQVNVLGTQNLLEGLTRSGLPKYFVFISSVSVYGIHVGRNIDETTPLVALDPYGISKIEAERIVLDWCKQHKIVCTILRLPLIVGSNPPGNLGSMIEGIQKGYFFNIGGGKAKKSMVLAEDVANFILKVAEFGGIYNLTDGYHPSFKELSNHISIQLGKGKPKNMPLWVARLLATFGDFLGNKAPLNTNKLNKITSDLTFDDNKARDKFGWNPKQVLEGFRINT